MLFEFETWFVCFDSFQCLIIFSQVDFKLKMNADNANANDEPVMPPLGLIPPNNNRRTADANINPHAQRRRAMLVPIDVFLINDHVMTFDNISINELSDPEIELKINMNKKHIDIQILRIITPHANTQSSFKSMCKKTYTETKLQYKRLLLCRFCHENSQLVYITISNENNTNFFQRNLILRDNGTITCGSYLRVIAPHQIERYLNGTEMIFSDYPAIALKIPSDVSNVRIDNALEGNRMKAGLWNMADVTIRRTAPIQTKCSGYHCDKQWPND